MKSSQIIVSHCDSFFAWQETLDGRDHSSAEHVSVVKAMIPVGYVRQWLEEAPFGFPGDVA